MIKDRVPVGVALPHRAEEPFDPRLVQAVARQAERLGFADLWVTENTLDPHFCLDPLVALTAAATVTSRVRLGVAVVVLPLHQPVQLAHRVASLDHLSRGRVTLGVGLGKAAHYPRLGIDPRQRVGRLVEGIAVLRALWSGPDVSFRGDHHRSDGVTLSVRPVQKRLPIWVGGEHPDAVRRAARVGDGWIGSGGGGGDSAGFSGRVVVLRAALAEQGRGGEPFPVSKRVFVAVDDRSEVARSALERWFGAVYGDPGKAVANGVHGTVDDVRSGLEQIVDAGATHLVLNPVSDFPDQVDALAEVVGLG